MKHLAGRDVSNSTYTNHGCRCAGCRHAHSIHQTAYMATRPDQRKAAADRERKRRINQRTKESGI